MLEKKRKREGPNLGERGGVVKRVAEAQVEKELGVWGWRKDWGVGNRTGGGKGRVSGDVVVGVGGGD